MNLVDPYSECYALRPRGQKLRVSHDAAGARLCELPRLLSLIAGLIQTTAAGLWDHQHRTTFADGTHMVNPSTMDFASGSFEISTLPTFALLRAAVYSAST